MIRKLLKQVFVSFEQGPVEARDVVSKVGSGDLVAIQRNPTPHYVEYGIRQVPIGPARILSALQAIGGRNDLQDALLAQFYVFTQCVGEQEE